MSESTSREYTVPLPPPVPSDDYPLYPEAARSLARLVEFGFAPEPVEPLPHDWLYAWNAVKNVRSSPADRHEAFEQAVSGFPQEIAMLKQMHEAMPVRENRQWRHRQVHDAADAFADPPVLDWCVSDLFPLPSLNLLVGDAGSKKTLLAIDLGISVAMGKPWLGRQVTACPVLYVDEETGRPRLWARLHGAMLAHQASPGIPFHYMSLPGYNFRDPDEVNDLNEKIESVGAGLVIIDALVDVLRGGDENSVLTVSPVFNYLRHLSELTHAAILVLHHNNKTGAFRGSSVISAGVDLLLAIQSPPNSTHIHLRPLKTRDVSPEPLNARIHFNADQFHLTPTDDDPAPDLAKVDAVILHYLAENGSATTPQLMRELSISTPGNIRRAIHELKASGFIERTNGDTHGQVALFQLTPKGRSFCQGT